VEPDRRAQAVTDGADSTRSLAQGLRSAGVRLLFGMPGGGPNLDVIAAAQDLGLDFVLAHGETAACIMAATYGQLTRTPGVAVVTRGPGYASASNGLAQATLDRFPLLLISDVVDAGTAQRVAHQRLDQVVAAEPLTKWSGTLGSLDTEQVVQAAAGLACAAPAGAVHLAFDPGLPGDTPPATCAVPRSDEAAWDRARQLLEQARRPVILIGLDAVRHAGAVRAALETFDCPVLVTYQAKGVVPESSPTYAGLFTGATMEQPLLATADLVLGVGLDPVEPMPGPWPHDAPVVLLHSYPVESSYFGEPLTVIGTYEADLPALLGACRPSWDPGAGQQFRQSQLERLTSSSATLSPQAVVLATHDALPGAMVTVDAGAHMLVAMSLWETEEPTVLISNGLATMGFALPAAIGAALAEPESRVVCFVGDGGLGMVLAELETLARLRLNITVVVFNDASLTLIKLKQRTAHGGDRAVTYGLTDFAAAAMAMGVRGDVVSDLAQLRDALARPSAGPHLIDARIDASVYVDVLHAIRG
jgi:acetolactate synthase I/II/III large subunit